MAKVKCIFICIVLSFSFTSKAALPQIIFLQSADSVGLFDKFEVGFNLKAEFSNPFNPDEIDVNAIFISPTGKQWKINGFYDYSLGTVWKVRFAANEEGRWNYVLYITDKNGKTSSDRKYFNVFKTSYHGPLKIAINHRYLEYMDGTSFYGVGFWYNDKYTGFKSGQIQAHELNNLSKLGVNFISSYITPLETIGSGLGRYDQNICGRIDELLNMCEVGNIQLSLDIWFHPYLSQTVWGGDNILWYTNPYQQITAAKDFYRSKDAWEYQKNLYRYFIARWAYSRSLAIWDIIDEINGTEGWFSGDYVMANKWAKNVNDYFKDNDPYHHLTTGTRSGGIREFWDKGYQTFDVAAREIYEAQGFPINRTGTMDSVTELPLVQSYKSYADQIGKLWDGYDKPAIIGESGWDHTFYEPRMPGYLATFHNALWVSLASGSSMTPFWWEFSKFLNDNMVTSQITSIRNFTDKIPFAKLANLSKAKITVSEGNAYAIKSNKMVFGWVANPRTDVAGKNVTIYGMKNGKFILKVYHTWRGEFLDTSEVTSSDGSISFSIPVLHMGLHANYIGEDIAFILEPVDNIGVNNKTKHSSKNLEE